MKQITFSVVLLKNTLMVGMAFCAIPFFSSVHAQNSGSQTQVLFEIQSMRQEIAELRDMVERQQYELRKMQRELQKGDARKPAESISSSADVIEFNRAPILGSNTGVSSNGERSVNSSNTTAQTTVTSVVGLEAATGVTKNAATIVQPAPVPVTTTAPSAEAAGREFPPVVEINVESAKPQGLSAQQGVGAIDASTAPVKPNGSLSVPAPIEDLSIGAEGSPILAEGSRLVVQEGFVEPSLTSIDIKPIETIRSEPLVSIPSATETVSAVKPVLDPASIVQVVSENDYYQQGFSLLKESKHPEAVAVFKKQISSYPKGDRADDAYYWIAESMYVNRKLDVSKENFKAIIQGYPKSERLPDAMLKLAYIEQEQGNIIETRILLQEIMQFHPKSDAALSAKNRLAEIK